MGIKVSEIPTVSTLGSSDLLLKSNAASDTYTITFQNFQKNFTYLSTTGSNTMQIGVSDSDTPVIRIPANTRYVGIGGGANFVPESILHISGYANQNTFLTIQPSSGHTGFIKLHDDYHPWYIGNVPSGKFFISGYSNDIHHKSINIETDGDILISDASQYSMSNVESGINIQLFAATGTRFTFDDGTNSNDIDFNYSGIKSDKDLYINYQSNPNILSGTFVGISGAVFIDHDNATVRIGNNDDRSSDARLMVTNDLTDGTSYKTFLVEDTANPNIFLRKIGVSTTASATFDPSTSQLYLGRNKSPGSISASDPVIFDLLNKRIGINVDPAAFLDISGSSALFTRYQSAGERMVIKYQLNSEVGSALNEIFTTYSTGIQNDLLVGFKFTGGYGGTGALGQYFWQTGSTSNTYNSANNIATLSTQGDFNIDGGFTSDDDFCQGKFIQLHRTSCSSDYTPVYLNLDNINYNHQTSGSLAYHSLCQLKGSVKGVDFTCQLNSGIQTGTGYLVFNRFNDLVLTGFNGTTYVSGTPIGSRQFFQLWDAENDRYKSPEDISYTNYVYVSGLITGQGFLNLQARRSNTTNGERFYGTSLSILDFNKFDNIGWVAYAVTGEGASGVTPLSGAKNLNTIISYLVENDTASEAGKYISQ